MMRSKPSLKNSIKPVLLFSLSLTLIFIFGCARQIEPTYKEKDIPFFIKKICKEEYNLEVTTQVAGKTLWVYAPISRIIHQDYEKNKEKIFDEEMDNKLRNIMTSIGRVLISSDIAPDFYCLILSDIKETGLDYILIGNVMDIKKSYAGFIPWEEVNRRYVIKLENAPQAIGDTLGTHLKPYDISEAEFLALQIAQRIDTRFRQEAIKNFFDIKSVKSAFQNNVFIFYVDIKITDAKPNLDIIEEALKIISAVLKDYGFKDFSEVNVSETATGKNIILSQKALFDDF